MDLTVLGCSGSYASPTTGPCSGYLVRTATTTVWMDCGNGSLANLARHVDPAELDGVVISHLHPDHCVDIYGLHVMLRYDVERSHLPVYAPADASDRLGSLVSWGDTFAWHDLGDGGHGEIGDLGFDFSRTDHPIPTYAVQVTDPDRRRLVYTSDTGPEWTVDAFGAGADVVVSEATYLHADRRSPIHLSGRQAGAAARAAQARRLVLTHFWPRVDPEAVCAEGSDAFGAAVIPAAVDLTITI